MKKYFYLLFIGLAFYVSGAYAHHSAYLYDVSKKVEVAGTIQTVLFANPHTKMTLVAKGATGADEVWVIESSSPLMLKRRGWTFDKIKVGDKVTIIGAPFRNGEKGIYMTGIRLQDGTEYGRQDANLTGLD